MIRINADFLEVVKLSVEGKDEEIQMVAPAAKIEMLRSLWITAGTSKK